MILDRMGRWGGKWAKLAYGQEWFPENLRYGGPAAYELGLGGSRYGNIRPVYVGETRNLKKRMSNYGEKGSHLFDVIDEALDEGYALYFRYQRRRTKRTAQRSEMYYLGNYDYPWNIPWNTDDWDQ